MNESILDGEVKIITIPPYSFLPEAVVYLELNEGECFLADLTTPIFDNLVLEEDEK